MSEFLKAESSATKGGILGNVEKAAGKMVTFPCGDGMLSPSQKGSGNLDDNR